MPFDKDDVKKVLEQYRRARRPVSCRLGFHDWRSKGSMIYCSRCGQDWNARKSSAKSSSPKTLTRLCPFSEELSLSGVCYDGLVEPLTGLSSRGITCITAAWGGCQVDKLISEACGVWGV